MHVFHLQGEVHQQLHRDSRISHPARNRSRTTHGSQFLGLLEKRSPEKKKKRGQSPENRNFLTKQKQFATKYNHPLLIGLTNQRVEFNDSGFFSVIETI